MYSSPVCPPGFVKKLPKGAAISSFFQYASQTNRTTLHAVIAMDGVYAGFAWSKKPAQLRILGFILSGIRL